MMMFYFYLACFTVSISYLVLPFQLVYVFQFLQLFFFFLMVFLKPLSSIVEKLLYTYIQIICITYIFQKIYEFWPN